MKYRREIDGLRAIAVLPVVLLHAGFEIFSGGFVGVDIFFVISGYLITNIILGELSEGRFSILRFYERRAKRILPALFVVMATCLPFAYAWMLPDDLKNFGQSLVATAFFSNNILLAITTGYWDLAGEFKPLLHTWSLGVEEQYYIFFPVALILAWRHLRKKILLPLWGVLFASLFLAIWGQNERPTITFYLLPTRAWELVMGALAAIYLSRNAFHKIHASASQLLSGLGLIFIAWSVFYFDRTHPSPSLYTLVPTLGAVLIILFANSGTLAYRFLGSPIMVGVGLVSYSFYLWHQPLFAFSRIYFVEEPTHFVSLLLIFVSLGLAFLTWKFIETPVRTKNTMSRRFVFFISATGSMIFVVLGLYLNKSYGMPWRVFNSEIRAEDMDKRIYNERVYKFKSNRFQHFEKKNILVIGNSFGRDFVNMTTETFDVSNMEIVYRDDFGDCIFPFQSQAAETLYSSADVIVFASGAANKCVQENIDFAKNRGVVLLYSGVKSFGYNLNWIVRLDRSQRSNQYNPMLPHTVKIEKEALEHVPAENYISLLAPIVKNNRIPITDEEGRMLSTDRAHLTKYGAIYFGQRILLNSSYANAIK